MDLRLLACTQEQILQDLCQRRTDELEPVIPPEEILEHFRNLGASLDSFEVPQAPAIAAPLLKRLGDPAFISASGLPRLLKAALLAISQAALEAAFDEREE